MQTLDHKVAIITGGGTGIGKGIAIALSKEGADVVICGRRLEPLITVARACSSFGKDIMTYQCDVSIEEDVKNFIGAVLQKYNHIDLLINNAGIDGEGYIHEHDVETWDKVMAINLRGPFLMARYILPQMRDQKSGHIINISSEAGIKYYNGYGAYGVAKQALVALGEYIQMENQDLGIRVNTICPGIVITDMMNKDLKNIDHSKSLYPEDIAELIIWLVERRANVKIGTPVLIQTMENPWILS
jgi:3-oxoacyl-[acyl-carrier protein] reductase